MVFTGRMTSIFIFRLLGALMLIIGVVTAVMNFSFGGFTPIFWFLLAFSAFLGAICHTLFRIKAILESTSRNKDV